MELLPSERKSDAPVTSQAARDVATDDDISEQLSVEEQTPESGVTSGSHEDAVLKIDLRAPAISTLPPEEEEEEVKTPTQVLSQPEVLSGDIDIRNIEPPSLPMSQEPDLDVPLELSARDDVISEQGSPRKVSVACSLSPRVCHVTRCVVTSQGGDESMDDDEVSRNLVSLIKSAEEEVKQFAQDVDVEPPATPILSPPPSHADSPQADAKTDEKEDGERQVRAAESVTRELLGDAVSSMLSVRDAKVDAENQERDVLEKEADAREEQVRT